VSDASLLGTHSLGVFAATVFVVNATPGVDMMFTLAQTLRHGVAGGIAAALGIVGGCVVHTLLAAFGLAALLAASATAFALVKWAGAAYLVWLAIGMLRAGVSPHAPVGDGARGESVDTAAAPAPDRATRPPLARLFRQGLLTNVLNPKIAIFFLALLPQFIDAGAPDKLVAFLFLGAWFVVQGALFMIAFVVLVAPLRRWRASPAWRRGLNAAGAGIFVWLAARLALVERT
jgi:threonine/homoserine/homoserine lactone efflux protein